MHAQSNLVSSGNSNNQVEKQLAQQLSLSKQQHEDTSSYASTINKNERVLDTTMDIDGKLYKKSNLSQAFEASNNSETMELNVEKVMGDSLLGESNPDHSTSILDKLFGSALTLKNGGSSNLLEVVMITSIFSFFTAFILLFLFINEFLENNYQLLILIIYLKFGI